MRVAIIDYGLCNLGSMYRAVETHGGSPFVTSDPKEAAAADKYILPGVGAFPDAMKNLTASGMIDALCEIVLIQRRPLLGVCLGMQLLADYSTEGGKTLGLSWIPGAVKRLEPSNKAERVPHVGWNEVMLEKHSPLFDGIQSGSDYYFVHSYHFDVLSENHVLAKSPYCGDFVSIVQKDNIIGVQFHPEKSQRNGMKFLANFLEMS